MSKLSFKWTLEGRGCQLFISQQALSLASDEARS